MEKRVPAGSWTFWATVSGIRNSEIQFEGDPRVVSQCLMLDEAGNILSSAVASTASLDADFNTLALNGGTFVPSGQFKTIGVFCRTDPLNGDFNSAHMMIMKVGGFTTF